MSNIKPPTGQSNETFSNLAGQELESQAYSLMPGCRVDSEVSRFYCGWKLVCNHCFFVVISRKQNGCPVFISNKLKSSIFVTLVAHCVLGHKLGVTLPHFTIAPSLLPTRAPLHQHLL